MNRRGFLAGMLAACAAPAIVKASSIMRVVPVVAPPTFSGEMGQFTSIRFYEDQMIQGGPAIGEVRAFSLLDLDRAITAADRVKPIDGDYVWLIKPDVARDWERALRGLA